MRTRALLASLAGLVMLLSLSACGGGDGNGLPPAPAKPDAVWDDTNWDNMRWQ